MPHNRKSNQSISFGLLTLLAMRDERFYARRETVEFLSMTQAFLHYIKSPVFYWLHGGYRNLDLGASNFTVLANDTSNDLC
jgi:hypothetical protein